MVCGQHRLPTDRSTRSACGLGCLLGRSRVLAFLHQRAGVDRSTSRRRRHRRSSRATSGPSALNRELTRDPAYGRHNWERCTRSSATGRPGDWSLRRWLCPRGPAKRKPCWGCYLPHDPNVCWSWSPPVRCETKSPQSSTGWESSPPRTRIAAPTALRPVVGRMLHSLSSDENARIFARACKIVVATYRHCLRRRRRWSRPSWPNSVTCSSTRPITSRPERGRGSARPSRRSRWFSSPRRRSEKTGSNCRVVLSTPTH